MHLELSKNEFYTRGGLLDSLLDNAFDQSIAVDNKGIVIYFSKSSQKFTKISPENIIGRHISTAVPDHKFEQVFKTGTSDNGVLVNIDGNLSIINHIPVKDKDQVIGAVGIVFFSNLATLKKLISQLSTSDLKEYADTYNNISRYSSSYTFKDYIGKSDLVKQLIDQAHRIADSDYPVLITGETGTGKEILANAIHSENKRTFLNPFIKINCSAIPNALLESELFGHEKGAFTGAGSTKKGKFEIASSGSILLDEIGELDIVLQAKLLRILQEKEFERVGGSRLLPTNARIIASTNANLNDLCITKQFRQDLYYRLNTFEIYVHPLREIVSDIPLLIEHFIELGQYEVSFTKYALDALMKYHWPGNIRQLKNMVNRFGVLNHGQIITDTDVHLALHLPEQSTLTYETSPIKINETITIHKSLLDQETETIKNVLIACNFNQSLAASTLQISRSTLIRKMKKYHLVGDQKK